MHSAPRYFNKAWIALLSVLAGCSQPVPQGIDGAVVLELNPSGNVPLAGLISFTTYEPMRATLSVRGGDDGRLVTSEDGFTTEHQLMVLGLKAGQANSLTVELESGDGSYRESTALSVTPAPLPEDFPPIDIVVNETGRSEPGFTFLPMNIGGSADQNVLVAIDRQGDVVWWMRSGFADQFRLDNGNLLAFYNDARQSMAEFDMLGNTVQRWHASAVRSQNPPGSIPVDTDTIHHDVLELPSGNFLAISTEHRHFESYPASETDPDAPWQPADVVGDVLVEFDRDGTVINEWHFLDLLDPYRFGYNSLTNTFYEGVYSEVLDATPHDWAHANGLAYDAETNSVIVSLRWICTVLKLNLDQNRIEWITGDPTGWESPWSELLLRPDGPVEWSYGQHAPELTPQGTFILYDNGSFGRAIPPNPQDPDDRLYSRAVEYAVDEENGTISQVWSYGSLDGDRFFTPFVGDIDRMPDTGNVLITAGALVRNEDGSAGVARLEGARLWARLIEVTHTDPAEIVWEARIDDPRGGLNIYRAERLPSLYP